MPAMHGTLRGHPADVRQARRAGAVVPGRGAMGIQTAGRIAGVVLLGVAAAGCAAVPGQNPTVRIKGLVREIAPGAGVLIVEDQNGETGAPHPVLFCPAVKVLKLNRDGAHRIILQRAAAEDIRRGDLVEISATDEAGVLRAVEVWIAPDGGS